MPRHAAAANPAAMRASSTGGCHSRIDRSLLNCFDCRCVSGANDSREHSLDDVANFAAKVFAPVGEGVPHGLPMA